MNLLYNYYKKYQEIINYLIMGFLTTIVSLVSYAVFAFILKKILEEMLSINIATTLSWVLAVIFAYVTNKRYVFKTITKKKETIKEFYEFVKYRIVSLVIDLSLMWLFVQILNINDIIAKLINQVVIIIINYIFSKIFIFKK